MRAARERGDPKRTVESVIVSWIFLPTSLVIHSSVGSLGSSGAQVLLMPGTTRGMVASFVSLIIVRMRLA